MNTYRERTLWLALALVGDFFTSLPPSTFWVDLHLALAIRFVSVLGVVIFAFRAGLVR